MKDQEIVPLRVVLRNFLNHIENLESQSCPEESYEAEFQDLKIFSENVKSLKEYSCLEGEKEVNRKKNRYKDILPFDISRVVLKEYAGIPGSDYINANFIKGASGSLAYIASQGPLPSTVNDFWRMVVQCEVQVIVMACNEEEAGKAKCEKYWVDNGKEKQFGMISVKLLKSSTVCPDFSVRTMRLKYTNSDSVFEERTVCQLHYVAWPDHGVPTVVQPLLDMVRLVRDTQASETLPVLVHCSAGCGRTGTICAIDYVWGLLRTGKLTNDFSLLSLIREMRKQRIAMVQTKEQYVLVHQAVRELFKEQLSMIDSHPYENIDTNGLLLIKETENTYDTIEYTPKISSEDKDDNKEKDSVPPPLPSKRNVSKFPSKYEKEIENLSAQKRSMKLNARSVPSMCPSNDKKKSSSKDHFNIVDKLQKWENQSKLEVNKPIPPKGILCVPQLESVPKCKPNVKRSKSLKVIRNCEKSTFSFCQSIPSETKRRSSLESNFDETIILTGDENSKFMKEVEPVIEQRKKSVPHLASKYDILKDQDHCTFVRSLTCVDLRPKTVFSHTNSVVSSLEESLAKQRVKLLRSNTQINVFSKCNSYSSSKSKNGLSNVIDSISGMKADSPSGNTRYFRKDSDKMGNPPHRVAPKPQGNSSVLKPQSSLRTFSGKDLLMKSPERLRNPLLHKLESLKCLKETTKASPSNNNRSDSAKPLPFEEVYENYAAERKIKTNHKSTKLSSSGYKMLHSSSYMDHADHVPLSEEEPKYASRINKFKHPRPSNELQVNKAVSLPKTNEHLPNPCGSSKDHYTSNRIVREDSSRLQLPRHEEFISANCPLKEEYLNTSDQKSSPSFNDHYILDESNNDEPTTSSWLERDSSRFQMNLNKPLYNGSYLMNRPKTQTIVNSSDDSKEVLWKLDGGEHSNSGHKIVFADSVYNKESGPSQQAEINYHLQNRKNIQLYNGSVHTSRLAAFPNVGPEPPNPIVNRRNPLKQSRMIDKSSGIQDISYYSPEIHRSYVDACFHSAPGVDIDQVAASITKNDENLMKATLEELQVRKTRLLLAPKESHLPPKGVPNSGSSCDKKRQQQYL